MEGGSERKGMSAVNVAKLVGFTKDVVNPEN